MGFDPIGGLKQLARSEINEHISCLKRWKKLPEEKSKKIQTRLDDNNETDDREKLTKQKKKLLRSMRLQRN